MQCEKCGEVFQSVSEYSFHKLQHQKIARGKCQQTFTSIANLTRHQRKTKKLNCQHCNGKFCNIEHLQKHIQSIPKEELPRSKKNTFKWIKQLDQPIYPSLYKTADGYQNLVRKKLKEIQDYEETSSYYQIYNK